MNIEVENVDGILYYQFETVEEMAEIPEFMLNQPDGKPVDLPELPQRD